jgi:hypothetical protein
MAPPRKAYTAEAEPERKELGLKAGLCRGSSVRPAFHVAAVFSTLSDHYYMYTIYI